MVGVLCFYSNKPNKLVVSVFSENGSKKDIPHLSFRHSFHKFKYKKPIPRSQPEKITGWKTFLTKIIEKTGVIHKDLLSFAPNEGKINYVGNSICYF